jgi:hypothetical protein
MRSLREVLVNDFGLGASLAGWTLTSANDISVDGQFIVGSGTNPSGNGEAWMARLVPLLPGDFSNDGTVDAADYVVWRKNPNGEQSMYEVWRANFGASLGVGAASRAAPSPPRLGGPSAAVPEPTALALGALALALLVLKRK